VIAESINQCVPQWRKLRDQQTLTQGNPNIVHDKKAAMKIGYVKIG